MRFLKGTKVEVLSKAEVPSGSWQCAEILYDDGHFYTVRYDGYHGTSGEAIVERVSRKAIRPCPPALGVTENWNPGDVVEVFQNFSWRMAIVLKVVWKKYILVRLLGSSLEFKVNKSDIRVRQSWQNNKWIVIGKASANFENGKHDDTITPRHKLMSSIQVQKTTKTKLSLKKDYRPDHKEVDFLESHLVSSKTLKRGRHSQVETYAEAPQKLRAVQNQSRFHRERVANQSTLLKQVDGDVFPRKVLAEECTPALVNNRKTRISEMNIERRRQIGAVGCSFAVNVESTDADSVTCSVGSCSIASSNSYKLCYPVSAGHLEDVDGLHSDAESFCLRRYEEGNCSHSTQVELMAEIHRLELHAYRCTIEALHASGPLSWEQEALMTNLRLSLHISNDEHLMELRNLISSENSIPIR
ncbi:plant tudor-like RNA-binding protein [Senna tora]|uniref:Plant tudor-like RNA-binding protein n=1 Tax=Senna tora TaxID=362788 RepID=A0A834X5W3_9FABA|nr:plant tudor-like RNA-binding protein [Senna tora]